MRIAKAVSIVALAMAVLVALGALTSGPILILPFALIPLAAGIGIWRKRVWSAYGFALYLMAQLLVPLIAGTRTGGAASEVAIIQAVVPIVILAPLFFWAGKALSTSGATRGRAWPWVALSVLTAIPIFFLQAFVMPNGSMENTLLIGDRVLVQRFPRGHVQRDDIVVFMYPIDRTQTFVKRVIGMPGDHIKLVNTVVFRNGSAVTEPYAIHKSPYADAYRDNFPSEPAGTFADNAREMLKNNVVQGEVVVPDGKYFVLGDNRDNSLDSRYFGFVGSQDLLGKPFLIYDSVESGASGKSGPGSHHRWNRIFKVL